MWQSLLDAYRERIVETGREPLFLLLVGLILAFLFIRFSVRMIRRGTSWWPGNVTPGGMHIHHVVFGQALLLICGISAFAIRGDGGQWWNLLGFGFGIGCGLVLDEFALVLHLEDVYWSEQGRTSVDAVVLAVAVIGLLLIGELPLGGFARHPDGPQLVGAGVLLFLVAVTLFKGKTWTGLLGVMLWPLALVGALRLARPTSPWARWRYRARPRRMARAERREARIHRRLVAFKTRTYDLVAGTPDAAPAAIGAGADAVGAVGSAPVGADAVRAEALPEAVGAEAVAAEAEEEAWEPGPVPVWRNRCAAAAEWYFKIATLLNALGALIEPFREQVNRANRGEFFTPVLITSGLAAALFTGLLAVMLRRRKRAAWIASVAVVGPYAALYALALSDPVYRAHPFNWVSAAVTAVLLAVLLLGRDACRVRGARGNVRAALVVLLVGGAVLVGVGAAVVRLTYTASPPGWGDAAVYVLLRLVTVSGAFEYADVDVPGWVDLALNTAGAVLLLTALRMLLRSAQGRLRQTDEDEARLRALLEQWGEDDSLGWFALRRDKAVGWAPSGRAAVLYRVVYGVALASGDPVGDPGQWAAAIEVWRREARIRGWIPAVVGASGRGRAVYGREVGLRVLHLADEAVVEADGFDLAAEGMDYLRENDRRLRAAGHRVVIRRHREVPEEEFTELVRLADAWRHGRTERGFSVGLGRLGDPVDADCLLAECRDENGRTAALLSFVPWGEDGLTLDLMRRDRESDPGLADFAVTEVLVRAGEFGVARVSLNFTAFRATFESAAGGVAGVALRLLARWWRLESRYRATTQYRPGWRERFVLYEKATELPAIASANATAEGLFKRRRLGR